MASLMIEKFTDQDVPEQSGRTALVTGANTGLGLEVARVLARRGARVLLGCRDQTKAAEARADILSEGPAGEVDLLPLDLADLESVRRAADAVATEARLDLLINNAGVMIPPLTRTKQGFELQLGVNHLGPFALTGLLLPKLMETPGSRVVHTASNAHRQGDIDFDDLGAERSYSRMGRYSQSKLANLLHAYELDRRLRAAGAATVSVAAHPGGSLTNLFRQVPRPLWKPVEVVGPLFLNDARAGAWPTLAAATHPDVEGGQYFGPSGPLQFKGPAIVVRSNRRSHDEALAKRLWAVSEEMTGVTYPC